MKKVILCLWISLSLLLTGCFSYRDINKVLFTTAMAIDVDRYNNFIIYMEAFGSPAESGENGEKMVFRGEGKTIFEALRSMTLGASYRFDITQTKVYIFSNRAAQYGIDYFLDFLHRDQEFLIRPYICIYAGDSAELMSLKTKETQYIGVFIKRLLDNIGASSRTVQMTMHDYYKQRLIGDRTSVVTLLEIEKNVGGEDKLYINGGAVIKNDKMIDSISKEKGQGFNFLLNNIESGTLEIKNPEFPKNFVTLEILKSKTKTDLKYEGDKVKLIKNIKVNTTIAEAQIGLRINEKNLKEIKETAENNIKAACYQVFDEFKDKGNDIFDVQEEFERRFPKKKKTNIIKDTDLIVNVQVEIESGVDDLDFINAEEEEGEKL